MWVLIAAFIPAIVRARVSGTGDIPASIHTDDSGIRVVALFGTRTYQQ